MRKMVACIGLGLALVGSVGCSGANTPVDDPLGAPVRTHPDEPSATEPAPGQGDAPDPAAPSSPSPSPSDPAAPSDPASPSTPPTGGCTSVTATPDVIFQEATSDTDVDWLDTDDARTADGQGASINFPSYRYFSSMFYARDFGLALPKNAQIKGVTLAITRKTDSSQTADLILYLADLGTLGAGPKGMAVLDMYGDDRAKQGYWPSGAYNTATYGSATDLWGATTLDASKVNLSSFGIAWSIKKNGGAVTAYVDAVKLTVHYCY